MVNRHVILRQTVEFTRQYDLMDFLCASSGRQAVVGIQQPVSVPCSFVADVLRIPRLVRHCSRTAIERLFRVCTICLIFCHWVCRIVYHCFMSIVICNILLYRYLFVFFNRANLRSAVKIIRIRRHTGIVGHVFGIWSQNYDMWTVQRRTKLYSPFGTYK